MATKRSGNKKTSNRRTGAKKAASRKRPAQKASARKTSARQTSASKTWKRSAKKKPVSKGKKALARKKPVAKRSAVAKKTPRAKTRPAGKRARGRWQSAAIESFASEQVRARSAGQSGDLQGLSDRAESNSESVDELIEEGNAFEAGIVSGVEEADGEDEREVHTHEVPEDDVPSEYLDED
jgi:hypothetical protein